MGSVDVLREITPLSQEDCFLVMQRPKRSFSYPLHVHPEFELNYLENAGGAIRIVGDSVEEMEELDLLLCGRNQACLFKPQMSKYGYLGNYNPVPCFSF